MITFCTAIELHPHANEIFPLQWSKAYHTCSYWRTKIMRNHSILVRIPGKFLKKNEGSTEFLFHLFLQHVAAARKRSH